MLHFLIAIAAGIFGFVLARTFVCRRLRFVDAVHSPLAPIIAGAAAATLAWPAAILPFVTLTTAIVFGIGTGAGTASGARTLRRDTVDHRRLAP